MPRVPIHAAAAEVDKTENTSRLSARTTERPSNYSEVASVMYTGMEYSLLGGRVVERVAASALERAGNRETPAG